MSKNHSFCKTILTTGATLFAINKFIDYYAKEKNICSSYKGSFYSWKNGEIYYIKQGEGSPILLIHDLNPASSTYDWCHISRKLSKSHTVYTIDLLGCGQSDKPYLTYTNYLFVKLVQDFVKDIIGEKTDVVTSGDSASFVIMANHMDETLFRNIIMINPCNLKEMKMETTQLQMILKKILFLPLVGTSLYNFYMREEKIKERITKNFYNSSHPEIIKYIDTFYQSAHIKNSDGRYLYASKLCSYTNIDMSIGLKEKENLYIIESTGRKNSYKIADAYTDINNNIEVTYLSKSRLLPQLEVPEQCIKIIKSYLEM